METTAQNDFDRAKEIISQSESFMRIRYLVFESYDEANYYYTNEPVCLLRSAMKKAISDGNEDLEVDCGKELYDFVSKQMSATQKQDIVEQCLIPLLDEIQTPSARGKLFYDIGKALDPLQDPQAKVYYQDAVEAGNDEVMLDENVIGRYPEFIVKWLESNLGINEKSDMAARLERRLKDLTAGKPSRPDICLRLAKLHQERKTGEEDKYFRECIRLGVEEVATSQDFIKPEYQDDYIAWYLSLAKEEDPIRAKEKCFEELWKTAGPRVFEKSHKQHCKTLLEKGYVDEAFSEYVSCATLRFQWASDVLIANIKLSKVQNAITDNLIDYWSTAPVQYDAIYVALGRLLDAGRGEKICKWKQLYSRCLLKLEEGALQAALAPFQEFMQTSGKDADFERHLGEKLDTKIEASYGGILLQEFTARRPRLVFSEKMAALLGISAQNQSYSSFTMNQAVGKLLNSQVDADDIRFFRSYLDNGSFPADLSMFRNDEIPLVSRYFLLKMLSSVVTQACYNATEGERDTMYNQGRNLAKAAQDELELCMELESSYLALMVWIADNLKSSSASEAESVLFFLATVVSPKQAKLPFYFLVNLFAKDLSKNTSLLLRAILRDDVEFNKWSSIGTTEELKSAVCRFLIEGGK